MFKTTKSDVQRKYYIIYLNAPILSFKLCVPCVGLSRRHAGGLAHAVHVLIVLPLRAVAAAAQSVVAETSLDPGHDGLLEFAVLLGALDEGAVQ
jgi:hypothetical protein